MILDLNWQISCDINYYDSEIFEQVLKRQEEEKFHIKEKECFTEFDKYGKKRETLKSKLRNMYRYHGLNREDAVFFNMSDLICNWHEQKIA